MFSYSKLSSHIDTFDRPQTPRTQETNSLWLESHSILWTHVSQRREASLNWTDDGTDSHLLVCVSSLIWIFALGWLHDNKNVHQYTCPCLVFQECLMNVPTTIPKLNESSWIPQVQDPWPSLYKIEVHWACFTGSVLCAWRISHCCLPNLALGPTGLLGLVFVWIDTQSCYFFVCVWRLTLWSAPWPTLSWWKNLQKCTQSDPCLILDEIRLQAWWCEIQVLPWDKTWNS